MKRPVYVRDKHQLIRTLCYCNGLRQVASHTSLILSLYILFTHTYVTIN